MTKFDHHQKNGAWVALELTTRPRIDRIASSPKPAKHATDAMLGKWVSANARHGGPGGFTYGNPTEQVTGQVWCAASTDTGHGPGWWWIASEGRYLVAHESTMTVVAERTEDAPMLEVAS